MKVQVLMIVRLNEGGGRVHKEQVTAQIVFYLQFEGVQVSKIVRVSEGGGSIRNKVSVQIVLFSAWT